MHTLRSSPGVNAPHSKGRGGGSSVVASLLPLLLLPSLVLVPVSPVTAVVALSLTPVSPGVPVVGAEVPGPPVSSPLVPGPPPLLLPPLLPLPVRRGRRPPPRAA